MTLKKRGGESLWDSRLGPIKRRLAQPKVSFTVLLLYYLAANSLLSIHCSQFMAVICCQREESSGAVDRVEMRAAGLSGGFRAWATFCLKRCSTVLLLSSLLSIGRWPMEAPGIEPGSRGVFEPASTCVADDLFLAVDPALGRLSQTASPERFLGATVPGVSRTELNLATNFWASSAKPRSSGCPFS
jgi:hypothetical protein